MSDRFFGEIRMTAFDFAPKGWALCNGQLLPISENQVLFSILGTTYGGNGQTDFALPDLRGRVPVHVGNSHTLGSNDIVLGENVGATTVSIMTSQLPSHSHALNASPARANLDTPAAATLLAQARDANMGLDVELYSNATANVALAAGTLGNAGSGFGLEVVQPSLVCNYIIALSGIFPNHG